MSTINLLECSIEKLLLFTQTQLSGRDREYYPWGIQGLSIFPKAVRTEAEVKTIGMKLDVEAHSGACFLVNKNWVLRSLLTSPELIEEVCRVHLIRVLNKHMVALLQSPDHGIPGWITRGCLASQLAAITILSDTPRTSLISHAQALINIHPAQEPFNFPKEQTLEKYLYLLKGLGKTEQAVQLSGIGPDDLSQLERYATKLTTKMQVSALDVAQVLKSCGNTPKELDEIIQGVIKPVTHIPWTSMFETRVSAGLRTVQVGSSYAISKRKLAMIGPHTGLSYSNLIVQPGVRCAQGPVVALAVDQSGSMSNEELRKAVSIIIGLRNKVQGMRLYVVPFDTDAADWYEVRTPDQVSHKRVRRGGTDFMEPLRFILGKKELTGILPFPNPQQVTTVIFATDGYGVAPAKEDIPRRVKVIWLLTVNGHPPYDRKRQRVPEHSVVSMKETY